MAVLRILLRGQLMESSEEGPRMCRETPILLWSVALLLLQILTI